MQAVRWKRHPDEHDYPAAVNYLCLFVDPVHAAYIATSLAESGVVFFKAKDLLRASRLRLLKRSNKHVKADLKRIIAGDELSPILVVRGDLVRGVPAQIADGYHRVCASYWMDENTDIPCQIVSIVR